jgi:hypothetical protein
VLHDGLVLTRKNPKIIGHRRRTLAKRWNSLPRNLHRPPHYSRSPSHGRYSHLNYSVDYDEPSSSARYDHVTRSAERMGRFDDRLSRSLSPIRLTNSLNENLAFENERIFNDIRSRSRSRSPSVSSRRGHHHNQTYDVLPGLVDDFESNFRTKILSDFLFVAA